MSGKGMTGSSFCAEQLTPAVLVLADGTVFRGHGFGALKSSESPVIGEVVFNTAMYGYQEIITDPSYAGQIMTFTYPHIGNVGCNRNDVESGNVQVSGVLIRNLSQVVSNFRAEWSFEEYLKSHNVMGITGLDTRALVTHLREKGAQMGAIAAEKEGEEIDVAALAAAAKSAGSMEGRDYVKEVTCDAPYEWNELPWSLEKDCYDKVPHEELWARPHVIAIDCGVKRNILRLLLAAGFRVTVMPATATATEITSRKPDGVFLSNGPGDPAAVTYVVDTVKDLIGRFPIFGICLGHQILALVAGGKTYKLLFGHRGANHPVIDTRTGRVEITTQNHGFAVDAESLPSEVHVTHMNLNDQTVAGLDLPQHRAFCVQYHPEASSGPHDSAYLFREFYERVVGGVSPSRSMGGADA